MYIICRYSCTRASVCSCLHSFRQFYHAAGGTSSSGTAGQGLNWNSSSQDSWWRDKLEVEPPLCISWKKPWFLVIGSRKNQSILSKTGGSHSPRGGHPKGSPTKGWLSDPVDHPVGQEEKQRSQQLENENLGIRATHFTGCFMEKGWHSNWFSIDGEETSCTLILKLLSTADESINSPIYKDPNVGPHVFHVGIAISIGPSSISSSYVVVSIPMIGETWSIQQTLPNLDSKTHGLPNRIVGQPSFLVPWISRKL